MVGVRSVDPRLLEMARSFRAGLQTAFAQMPGPPIPVIAIGYSYGASLAFTYAANARTWQLPTPTAVDVVFPASPIPGFPLPHLARTTRVLVEVGDADTVAGSVGADAFWRWLATHSVRLKSYVVIHSRPGDPSRSTVPVANGFFTRTANVQLEDVKRIVKLTVFVPTVP